MSLSGRGGEGAAVGVEANPGEDVEVRAMAARKCRVRPARGGNMRAASAGLEGLPRIWLSRVSVVSAASTCSAAAARCSLAGTFVNSEAPGRLRSVLSHPFCEERKMDGARSICGLSDSGLLESCK